MFKRIFDLIVGIFLSILLAPVLLAIALIIKLDSPGPVLFLQKRVGRYGRLFNIVKFRTMHTAAHGRKITVGNDSRITRVGAYLRKSRFDELPQLFNIIAGDMSIVGPRPEVPEYVVFYPPDVKQRIQSLRPGVTDLASIHFRNESDILAASTDPEKTYVEDILPVKLRYFVEYAESNSLRGDLGIIWQTCKLVLWPGQR